MSDPIRFPGLGIYLDEALAGNPDGPQLKSRAVSDSTLSQIGDLVGQAFEHPEHARGILDAALEHYEVLALRRYVARTILTEAYKALTGEAPPVRSPPKPKPSLQSSTTKA